MTRAASKLLCRYIQLSPAGNAPEVFCHFLKGDANEAVICEDFQLPCVMDDLYAKKCFGMIWSWGFAIVPRVLRPPGGGSNFSLGFDEPTEQPVRRNKMASSIFGTPEENPPSWAKSAGMAYLCGHWSQEGTDPAWATTLVFCWWAKSSLIIIR